MTLHVMTASLLKEGLVAYLQLDGEATSWTIDISDATAVAQSSIARLEIAAQTSEAENIVIAPYVIDVVQAEAGLQAATKREQIRATGPTIRLPRDSSMIAQHSQARHAA